MNDLTRSPDFRVREVLARPVWSFDDLCLVSGIARSTLEMAIQEHPVPGMFTIGRKRHVLADNAMAWLKSLEKAAAYVPRRNNQRAKAAA